MAKERQSAAFKGLLAGWESVKNQEEFDWRKAQAKIAANQWAASFKQKADQFNQEMGFNKEKFQEEMKFNREKLQIEDENADNAARLEEMGINARTRHTDAMTETLLFNIAEAKKESARRNQLREKASTYGAEINALLGTQYQEVPQVTAEELFKGTGKIAGPGGVPFDPYKGMDKQQIADEINATNFAKAKLDVSMGRLKRLLDKASTDPDGQLLLGTQGQTAFRTLAGNVNIMMNDVKAGKIKDPALKKQIADAAAMIFPYLQRTKAEDELSVWAGKQDISTKNKMALEQFKYDLENPED